MVIVAVFLLVRLETLTYSPVTSEYLVLEGIHRELHLNMTGGNLLAADFGTSHECNRAFHWRTRDLCDCSGTCTVPEGLVAPHNIEVGLFAEPHSKPLALNGEHFDLPRYRLIL